MPCATFCKDKILLNCFDLRKSLLRKNVNFKPGSNVEFTSQWCEEIVGSMCKCVNVICTLLLKHISADAELYYTC